MVLSPSLPLLRFLFHGRRSSWRPSAGPVCGQMMRSRLKDWDRCTFSSSGSVSGAEHHHTKGKHRAGYPELMRTLGPKSHFLRDALIEV